jgi:hypothetical protein
MIQLLTLFLMDALGIEKPEAANAKGLLVSGCFSLSL